MVKKEADNNLGSYLLTRFGQYGVPTALTGAGLAGLAHLISLYKEKKKDEAEKTPSSNELVIEVPVSKNAEQKEGDWGTLLDAPVGMGFTVGGLGLGYYVVDKILKKKRQEVLNKELESTKKEYSNYLAQELSPQKSGTEYPTLDGLVLATIETVKNTPVEDQRKQAAATIIKNQKEALFGSDEVRDPNSATILSSLAVGLPFLATLLGGHYLYYNRKKDIQHAIEKEEAESMKRTPENIKIVTKPVVAKQNKDVSDPSLLLEKGAFLEASIANKILEKIDSPKEDVIQEDDGVVKRKEEVIGDKDLQKIDDNTYVLLTEGGNAQIDALDPEALKILEQHKDKILKSFALGMNIKK